MRMAMAARVCGPGAYRYTYISLIDSLYVVIESMSIRTIILRVTQEDYDKIAHWKKPGESWEQYALAMVKLIADEIYGEGETR